MTSAMDMYASRASRASFGNKYLNRFNSDQTHYATQKVVNGYEAHMENGRAPENSKRFQDSNHATRLDCWSAASMQVDSNHSTRVDFCSSHPKRQSGKMNGKRSDKPSNYACEFAVLRYLENLDYISDNTGMQHRPANEAMELFAYVNEIKFPKKYMSRSYRSQFIYSLINGNDQKRFQCDPKKYLTVMSVCRRQSSKKSGKWHFIEKDNSPFLVVVKALYYMGFFETNEQTWEAIKEFLDLNGLLCEQPIGSYDQVSNETKKRIIYDIYRLLGGKRHLFKRNVKNPDPAKVRSAVIHNFITNATVD